MCCGSRELMTLDAFIEAQESGDCRDLLRQKRLWLAFESLGEGNLDDFAQSLAFYADLEEPADFECGFWDFFHSQTDIHIDPDDRKKFSEDVPLDLIRVSDSDEMKSARKKAIARLWRHFDNETRRLFLEFAHETIQRGRSV